VIGPGWLPRYRPRGLAPLRRTLAYRRTRTKSRKPAAHAEPVVFDRRIESLYDLHLGLSAAEFPLATVRPREARGQVVALVGALQRWLIARWQWLRPRSLPCAVAGIGMIAVLAFSDYLAHYNEGGIECTRKSPTPSHIEVAPR
jgi:hypothetical protein